MDPTCPQNSVNHGVTLVGYGTDANHGDYWIVRNQWGLGWGANGYISMAKNVNQCNITSYQAYVVAAPLNGPTSGPTPATTTSAAPIATPTVEYNGSGDYAKDDFW